MTNILLADDHDLVRDTIAAYLQTVEDFDVLTAPDLSGALARLQGDRPIDLLILDYNMPGMNGLQGLEATQQHHPQTKIALMSGVANRDVATSAMERGAHGFLPKSLPATSLVNAIKFVLSGERYFPFDFAATPEPTAAQQVFATLSEREMHTLEKLSKGLSNKEIARVLGIQEVTVKLHVRNLLAKLNVSNRTQAALLAKEKHLF